MKKLLVIVFALLLASCASSPIHTQHTETYFDEWDSGLAIPVSEYAEKFTVQALKSYPDCSVRCKIYLVYWGQMKDLCGQSEAVGCYNPYFLIIFLSAGDLVYRGQSEGIIRHEIQHLILHQCGGVPIDKHHTIMKRPPLGWNFGR